MDTDTETNTETETETDRDINTNTETDRDTETDTDRDMSIPRLDDMNDTNPLKTMMDTMGKHGAPVELKRRMPDGTYQTASDGTMKALGAQARMSSTAQVLQSMTREEKDAWAIEMRHMANELYKEGKFDQALGRYMEALTASDLGTGEGGGESNIDTVIVPLLCNMSACCVQLKDWGKVVRFCEQCLELRPQCVKALSRRGLARVQLGDYCLGESDALNALDLLPAEEIMERERVRVVLLKARRGGSEQNKALEKRKVAMQRGFAAVGGGIGDSRVVEPRRKRDAPSPPLVSGRVFSMFGAVVVGVLGCVLAVAGVYSVIGAYSV